MATSTSVRDRIRAALDGTRGLVSVYLFGSAARGHEHRESDLDLGVLLDHRICAGASNRFDTRLRLIALLQSRLAREVDLVLLNDAPPQLARHIMTKGQRLLVMDAALDHAHLRTTLSRAADLEPFLRRARAVKLQVLTQ